MSCAYCLTEHGQVIFQGFQPYSDHQTILFEIKSEIIDTVEGIQEELKKPEIKKGRIKSFITSLQTKIPSIGTAIEVGAAITELITFAQQFIK